MDTPRGRFPPTPSPSGTLAGTRFPSFPVWALLMAAGLGFLGGIVGSALTREPTGSGASRLFDGQSRSQVPGSTAAPEQTRPGPSSSSSDSVVDVVERSSPAVVNVIVTKNLTKLEDVLLDPFSDPFLGPSPFRFRVRRPSGEVEKREVGGGTGFVVDAEGLILTNRHVVADEEADYTVLLNTGENVAARVLARDPVLDLAILRVEKRGLSTISLGDSNTLKVGQTVVAIGNALGEFRNTVSVGVISGLGRQVTAGDRASGQTEVLDAVIQTDAAINPGNSGGPLLNLRGEAIGINTAVAGGAENIGFAIPSSEAARILQDVRSHGRIIRPFLGVRYVLITPALVRTNTFPVEYGAFVLRGEEPGQLAVTPGSSADRAGIEENDILLEFDGQRIDPGHTLASLIRRKRVGERVKIKLLSKGEEKIVEATLDEAK